MASIGHLLVGLALSHLPTRQPRPVRAAVLMAAAMLPDADWLGMVAGVPYLSEFGHRGAAHSFAAATVAGLLALPAGRRMAALVGLAVASHPVLDAFTDGGGGVALYWPWSTERHFWPWRPIPVSPLGAGMLSARGLRVLATELLIFAPIWLGELWLLARRLQKGSSSRLSSSRSPSMVTQPPPPSL